MRKSDGGFLVGFIIAAFVVFAVYVCFIAFHFTQQADYQKQRADRWEAYGRSLEKAYYGRDRTGSLPRPIPFPPQRLEAGQ